MAANRVRSTVLGYALLAPSLFGVVTLPRAPRPFFKVLNGPRIPAPGGAAFAAGFDALKPYFDECE